MTGDDHPRSQSGEAGKLACAAGVVGLAVCAVIIARGGVGAIFGHNDAVFIRLVAKAPFARGGEIAKRWGGGEAAYRYGRVLQPVVAWILAAGRPGAVDWTLPLLDVAALALLVGCAAQTMISAGVDAGRAVAVLAVPGVWIALMWTGGELVVLGLLALTYLLWLQGRRTGSALAAAALLLARESAGLLLLPLAWRDVRDAGWRAGLRWAAALLPMLGWWTWVRVHIGTWPIAGYDDVLGQGVGAPLAGLRQLLPDPRAHDRTAVLMVVAATVVLAALAMWRRPWFPFAAGAGVYSLLVVSLGDATLRYPGETLRVASPAHLLAVLALTGSRRTRP